MSNLVERKPQTESIEVILSRMNNSGHVKYSIARNRDVILDINPNVILTKICEALGVDVNKVKTTSRKRELADARKIIAHHLSIYSTLNQDDIQSMIGITERSSVSTMVKQYITLRNSVKEFRDKCNKVDEFLKTTFSKPISIIKPEYSIFDKHEVIHSSSMNFVDRDTMVEFVKDTSGKHLIKLTDRMNGCNKIRLIMTAREFMVLMNEATTIMKSEEFANYIVSDEYEGEGKKISECVIKSSL